MSSRIVIPAKAGTQHNKNCRRMATSSVCSDWAPACAGVTEVRDV